MNAILRGRVLQYNVEVQVIESDHETLYNSLHFRFQHNNIAATSNCYSSKDAKMVGIILSVSRI